MGAARTRRRFAISPGRTTKTQMSMEAAASSENNCTAVARSATRLNAHAHRARESSSHLNKKAAQMATRRVLSAYGRALSAFRMRSVLVAVRTAAMMPHQLPAMRRPVQPTTTMVPKYAKSERPRTHTMFPETISQK